MRQLVIIGASGHGKVIADIARLNGYTDIVFLDDDTSKKSCNGYLVLGCVASAKEHQNSDYIVAIGNAKIRKIIQEYLINNSFNVVSLIHPNALIAEKVNIGKGTVVVGGAVINPNTVIGAGCIINTSSSVDHDCIIGDFVHISVGAHVAGTVEIGSETWIGAGAIVNNNLIITSECMIGAGAVVVKDVKKAGTYVGVPAKEI